MIGRARVPFLKTSRCPDVDGSLTVKLESLFGKDRHFLFFPSARSALYFGLRHLQVEYVVLPAFTCKAVLEAALFADKIPVFADVNKETCCMDLAGLKRIPLDGRYAVLCTHQFGFPAPLEEVANLCRSSGAVLLEDCAASFGTMHNDVPTGSSGYFSIFSGDVFKMLPVIAGIGMLMSKDRSFAERIQQDNSFGAMRRSKLHRVKAAAKKLALAAINRPIGYGLFYTFRYRFSSKKTNDTPQPRRAIPREYFFKVCRSQKEEFLTQLSHLSEYLEKRRSLSLHYFNHLKGLKHIRALDAFVPINDSLGLIRFPIFIKDMDKMEFYRKCVRAGIDLGFVFSFPLLGSEASCPNAAALCKTVLNLPMYPGLTRRELNAIVDAIHRIDEEA